MFSLGKDLDVCHGIVPVDLAAGANTGARVHMRNYQSILVVLYKAIATAGTDNVVVTLQEHTAASSGTSANLAAIDRFWYKRGASSTLAGTEQWTEVTQTAAATVTLAGATYAALEAVVAFSVEAASLSDGYDWMSVNIADPGSGGTILGGVLYIPTGLMYPDAPASLANPNT